MAFTASAILEVEQGGSDTLGTGVFDPGVAGFDATASVASANTSAPVVTVNGEAAGDLNMWFYLKSGTGGVISGFYQITNVDTVDHKYTLNAAIGAAVLANFTLNTAVGCGTAASLTSCSWGVDFSQTTGNIATGTVTTAAAVATATTAIFRKPMVGNGITNGTAWRVIVGYTSTTVVTLDASPTWTAQSVSLGGALASPGMAGSLMQAGNDLWIKNGTYTVTSATANIAGGCLSTPASSSVTNLTNCSGYLSVRGDGAAKPTIISDGVITTFVLLTVGTGGKVSNLTIDGNSRTSSRGINAGGGNSAVLNCKAQNCTNNGIMGSAATLYNCEVTGCSTQPAISQVNCFNCYSHGNTVTGFSTTSWGPVFVNCISAGNTGITSDGFVSNGPFITNCTSYANGRDAFRAGNSTSDPTFHINCLAVGSVAGWGFNVSSANEGKLLYNCAGQGNFLGNVNTTNITYPAIGFVTLTTDPFISAATGNFALTPLAISLLAGIPGGFSGLANTTGFTYIGAVQPQARMYNPIGSSIIQSVGVEVLA